MTDDEKRIELLTKWNEQKDETIKQHEKTIKWLEERLKKEEECGKEELKKTLTDCDYYRHLYRANENDTRGYYLAGLAIMAIVAAASVMKILL